MRIVTAELRCPGDLFSDQRRFYGDVLGFTVAEGESGWSIPVGNAQLGFAAADAPAFYHLALLVPAKRFAAARDWAAERAVLLAGGTGITTFEFSDWRARAVYFHDPAGNIVELIAHDARETPDDRDPFEPGELAGISEVGMVVGDPPAAAAALRREAGLELWSGNVEGPGALAFVGRRAHTLIVVAKGRGWLPTGRPAEPHPVAVTLAGPLPADRETRIEEHRITTRAL